MCMLAKLLLVAVFVPLCLPMRVIAPLDAGIMNVILCLAGGVLFSFGGGVVSRQVLRRSDLV